jgi:predicted Zn-dependent peptidase
MNGAKLNLQKNQPENRQRNNWWMSSIELYLTYGQDRDKLYEEAVNNLTKADITCLLNEILSSGNFIEVVMKPAATAEAE